MCTCACKYNEFNRVVAVYCSHHAKHGYIMAHAWFRLWVYVCVYAVTTAMTMFSAPVCSMHGSLSVKSYAKHTVYFIISYIRSMHFDVSNRHILLCFVLFKLYPGREEIVFSLLELYIRCWLQFSIHSFNFIYHTKTIHWLNVQSQSSLLYGLYQYNQFFRWMLQSITNVLIYCEWNQKHFLSISWKKKCWRHIRFK